MAKLDHIGTAKFAATLAWSACGLLLLAATHGQQREKSKPKPTRRKPRGSEEIIPLHQLEKEAIQSALTLMKGDKTLAAKTLGIAKTTLYRKLKKYGIVVATSIAVQIPG